MTRKNKLLCLIVCSVLCVATWASLLLFSARADVSESIPTPPQNAIEQIDPIHYSGTQRYSTSIVTTTPTSSDWIIFEWTNGEDNEITYGSSNFLSLMGMTKNVPVLASADTNAESDSGVSLVNAFIGDNAGKTVKLYMSVQTNKIYASYDGEEPTLIFTCSKKDYADTDPVYGVLRLNNISTVNVSLLNLKAYDEYGNDLNVTSSMDEAELLETPNASSVIEKNFTYKGVSASKWFTTQRATTSEKIIFEWTNANTNSVELTGGHAFFFGLTDTRLTSINTSKQEHSYGSGKKISAGASAGKTVKLVYNTVTGEIHYTTGGLFNNVHTLVTMPQSTEGGVYASFAFNQGQYDLTFNNMKAYDGEGNDLGVLSNCTLVPPEVDSSEVDGVDAYSIGNSRVVIGIEQGTTSNWVFFEWTNDTVFARGQNLSGGEGLSLVAGKTRDEILYIHENSAVVVTNTIYSYNNGYEPILREGATVRIAFPMRDAAAPIVYVKDEGETEFTIQQTPYFLDEFSSQGGNFNDDETLVAIWMNSIFTGADGFKISNLKVFDENGASLTIDLFNINKVIEVPEVENSSSGIDVVSTGTSTAMFRTAEQVTSNWVTFEWTNAEDAKNSNVNVSGGSGLLFMAAPTPAALVQPHQNPGEISATVYRADGGYATILEAGTTVKVVFCMTEKIAPFVYVKPAGETEFVLLNTPYNLSSTENTFAKSGGKLNEGNYYVGVWMNAIYKKVDDFKAIGLKAYDENGRTLDLAFNLMEYETTSVTFVNGVSSKTITGVVPGNTYKQIANAPTPSDSKFVGWTVTEGGLDFVSDLDAVSKTPSTVYARYADSVTTDLSQYVGVYKNDNAYFEIAQNGKIKSYFSSIPSGDFKVFEIDSKTYVKVGGEISEVTDDNLMVLGSEFVKVDSDEFKAVNFYADNKLLYSIKVPVGMKAPANLTYNKTAHTFKGWLDGEGRRYNLSKLVTEDVNLYASYKANLSPEESYLNYCLSYYDRESDTLYIIKYEDGEKTYVKVVEGVETTGAYVIVYDTESTSVEYLVFDENYDSPVKVTKAELKFDKNYFRLQDRYVVTLNYGGTEEEKIEVTAETNYKAVLPENPTKEGYVFKGWKLSDGSDFDENEIVSKAITLYAVWELAVEEDSVKVGGLGALAIISIIVACLAVAGGVVFVLYKKGVIFQKKSK